MTVVLGLLVSRRLSDRQRIRDHSLFVALKLPVYLTFLRSEHTPAKDWAPGGYASTLRDDITAALADIERMCRGRRSSAPVSEAAQEVIVRLHAANIRYFEDPKKVLTKEELEAMFACVATLTGSIFPTPPVDIEARLTEYVQNGLPTDADPKR